MPQLVARGNVGGEPCMGRVASHADFMQQHAVLIKQGAAGGSALSGEACAAGRSVMVTIPAAGELMAGGDRSAVMVTKSFFGREK